MLKIDRECGECYSCCEIFPIKVFGTAQEELCPFSLKQNGCSIYESRPQDPCRGFNCHWMLQPLAEELRPDKSKAIVEHILPTVFLVTQDSRHEMTKVMKDYIGSLLLNGFSVIVNEKGKEVIIYKNPKHNKDEIRYEFLEHVKKRNK